MIAPAVILFDLDDVLVRYDRTVRVRHLAAATGASVADVWRALFESGLETESDLGQWQRRYQPVSYRAGRSPRGRDRWRLRRIWLGCRHRCRNVFPERSA